MRNEEGKNFAIREKTKITQNTETALRGKTVITEQNSLLPGKIFVTLRYNAKPWGRKNRLKIMTRGKPAYAEESGLKSSLNNASFSIAK